MPESQKLACGDACCKPLRPRMAVKMVVEEEEVMGDKGEEGCLLIPALVRLTSIINRWPSRGATAERLQF